MDLYMLIHNTPHIQTDNVIFSPFTIPSYPFFHATADKLILKQFSNYKLSNQCIIVYWHDVVGNNFPNLFVRPYVCVFEPFNLSKIECVKTTIQIPLKAIIFSFFSSMNGCTPNPNPGRIAFLISHISSMSKYGLDHQASCWIDEFNFSMFVTIFFWTNPSTIFSRWSNYHKKKFFFDWFNFVEYAFDYCLSIDKKKLSSHLPTTSFWIHTLHLFTIG